MVAPLLFALSSDYCSLTRAAAPGGPAFPAFTSRPYQDAVRAVEKALDAGDFAGAQRLSQLLPKRNFGLQFDESRLPAAKRASFRDACRQAMYNWGATVGFGAKTPDIRISFEPSLAADRALGGPANVAVFFSTAPGAPRLSVVLGLRRDSPERDATADDVMNDVRYAIGAYIGLANHPYGHYVMDPSAHSDAVRAMWPVEHKAAVAALNLADLIRRAVDRHTPVGYSEPSRPVLGPARFSGEALQGDQMEIPIHMANSGRGTLVVDAVGDCSCVIPESAPDLPSGGKGTLEVRLDTRNVTGAVDRSLIVLTNDPDRLMFTSDIHLDVSPRHRLLLPEGSTWVVGAHGGEGDAYMWFGKGVNPKILDTRLIGNFPGKVTCEPWQGTMADPDLNQPAQLRHGYHLHVTVQDTGLAGRYPVNLSVFTDDPAMPEFTQTIYLQHGIVALPEELLMDVGAKAKTMTVLLSRPGQPFGVVSATSSISNVHVATRPGDRPGEVKLDVTYDGHAPKGDLAGAITVKTTDPSQPTMRVRIVGSVQ